MKKFILKSALVLLPFTAIYLMNHYLYQPGMGDLIRLGYMYHRTVKLNPILKKKAPRIQYTLVTELGKTSRRSFTILTIGDSFSEQGPFGFKNFLADGEQQTVLHTDMHLTNGNQVQTLSGMFNGDFFDSVKVKYVVLQIIERAFVQRIKHCNPEVVINAGQWVPQMGGKDMSHHAYRMDANGNPAEPVLPSRRINMASVGESVWKEVFTDAVIKTPFTNLQYLYTCKPAFSKTYRVKTHCDSLFTDAPPYILFYEEDVDNLVWNNNQQLISESNQFLNQMQDSLSSRGIQLIVLISPDKYDLYYSCLDKTQGFQEPLLFQHLDRLEKRYLYVSLKPRFMKNGKVMKDVYYYGDTHWTILGAKIAAEAVKEEIRRFENPVQPNGNRKLLQDEQE